MTVETESHGVNKMINSHNIIDCNNSYIRLMYRSIIRVSMFHMSVE